MIPGCVPVVDVGCAVTHAATAGAQAVAHDLLDAAAGGVAAAAGWLMGHVITVINATTTVNLAAAWFRQRQQPMIGLMTVLVLPLLLAATLGAVIRQDLRRLARTWFVALPVAVVVTVPSVALTQFALRGADQMTAAIGQGGGVSAYRSFARVLVTEQSVPGGTPAVTVLLAVLVILGALSVWLELVVRSAAVYVAVFFLPVALAGLVWPATAHLTRRLIETLVGLILVKFVIVATLSLGAGAMTSVQGVDQVAAGTAILLLAAFAPFVLFRMVPLMEAAAVAHLEGLSRRPARAVSAAASRAGAAGGSTGALLSGRGAGGPSILASAVNAQHLHTPGADYDPATGGPPASGGSSRGSPRSGGRRP